MNAAAVRRVFDAKGRAEGRPLPLLIADTADAHRVAASFPEPALRLAARFWPGALTIVVPAVRSVPAEVTAGSGTVGLRVPAHQLARRLIRAFGGPLTGTSANRSGKPPLKLSSDVQRELGASVDLVIAGRCGSSTSPSTVVDVSVRVPVLIRSGAITAEELREVVPALAVPSQN
jgi:L-threonylcarbamoyladenylate synthase